MTLSVLFFALIAATAPDTFVYNSGAETETLDPHRMSSHDGALLSTQMLEGLVARGPDYMTLRPGLAREWKQSKDGKTYTFKIRKNLKWSNGEPLTIEHIRGSLLRAMNPMVTNQYIEWYQNYIKGADKYIEHYLKKDKAKYEKALGIKIIDKETLVIELKEPSQIFVHFLTQPPFFVVHPSMYDPNSKAWTSPEKYIANAAYKLKEWTVNKRIVMVKNKNYYDADKVSLDSIIAYPIEEQNTTFSMYRSNQLDWTGENTVPSSMVPALKKRPDYEFTNAYGSYFYQFNIKKKPLNDIRVRKALSLLLEREHITDKILRDGKLPSHRLVPPGIEGFKSIVPDLPSMDERIKEAKKLLADAGYPNGKGFPEFTILYNTSEGHKQIAQAIQQMWKKHLGVNVQIRNQEWKIFLKEQRAKNFDIARMGWIGDYPDPKTFLEIFHSKSPNNHTNWSNKAFDGLLEQAMKEQDTAKRFEILAKAEKILMEELPVLPLYHYVYYSLMNPKVQGFKPNLFGMYSFRYLKKKP